MKMNNLSLDKHQEQNLRNKFFSCFLELQSIFFQIKINSIPMLNEDIF